jgi:hypothetical protein
MKKADVVVDALLGIGLKGPPRGREAEFIQAINTQFPKAEGSFESICRPAWARGRLRARGYHVTFTAPKVEHFFAEGAAENVGRLIVKSIGSPPELIQSDLEVSEVEISRRVSRRASANRIRAISGTCCGRRLARKVGCDRDGGLAALRSGAGLVTVASWDTSRLAPELMTETLGGFTAGSQDRDRRRSRTGLNRDLVQRVMRDARVPLCWTRSAQFHRRAPILTVVAHPPFLRRIRERWRG